MNLGGTLFATVSKHCRPPWSLLDRSRGRQVLLHGWGAHFGHARQPPHRDLPSVSSQSSELQGLLSRVQVGSRGELVTLQLHWGPHESGTFRDIWRGGSWPRRKLFTSITVLGELHLAAVARPAL